MGGGQADCPAAAAVNSKGASNPRRIKRRPAASRAFTASGKGFKLFKSFISHLRGQVVPALSVVPRHYLRGFFYPEGRGGGINGREGEGEVKKMGRGRAPAAPPGQEGRKLHFFLAARRDRQIRSYSGNALTFFLKFIINIC
jgi:hypothetical protein